MKNIVLILMTMFLLVSCDDDFATGSDAQPVASTDTLLSLIHI